jgi:hypothetical protein
MPSNHLTLFSLRTSFARDQPAPRTVFQHKSLNLPHTAFGNLSCGSIRILNRRKSPGVSVLYLFAAILFKNLAWRISLFQESRQAGFMNQARLKGID